jgi:hypothetical protein
MDGDAEHAGGDLSDQQLAVLSQFGLGDDDASDWRARGLSDDAFDD